MTWPDAKTGRPEGRPFRYSGRPASLAVVPRRAGGPGSGRPAHRSVLAERVVQGRTVVRQVAEDGPPGHGRSRDHEARDPDAERVVAHGDAEATEERVVEGDHHADRGDERDQRLPGPQRRDAVGQV